MTRMRHKLLNNPVSQRGFPVLVFYYLFVFIKRIVFVMSSGNFFKNNAVFGMERMFYSLFHNNNIAGAGFLPDAVKLKNHFTVQNMKSFFFLFMRMRRMLLLRKDQYQFFGIRSIDAGYNHRSE